MYIWFGSVFGTAGCFELVLALGEDVARVSELSEFPCTSAVGRLLASERAVGKGGGKGEMEMDDMLAEWAW